MMFTETDIHRLIDGDLEPAAAREVQAWVESDPARSALADLYRDQGRLLHARFDGLLSEAVPAHLTRAASMAAAAGANGTAANQPWFRRFALQAVFAVVCAGAGWLGHAWVTRPAGADTLASLPRRAAVAHAVFAPEVRHPVEVGADQEAHLVQWLSKRLATPVRAPGLTRQGFRLVGGRLLPGDDRPVAQFMYQNEGGRRLTLYVVATGPAKPGTPETAFRFEKVGAVNVFSWNEDGRGYALSGDIPREELMPIARAVYEELNTPAPAAKAG